MSPFEIFRRNLKPLMIFLTFLALMSFVVLPVVSDAMRQSSSAGSNAVAAKYSGKELTRSRVDYFTRNHYSLVQFLSGIAEETIKRGGSPKTAGFGYDAQQKRITSLGINSQPGTEATIRTFMFADQAAKEGFELDDNSLSYWLDQFTDGTMSEGEVVSRLMKATRNAMGRPHLYEQLRNHLLADVYLRRGSSGFMTQSGAVMTPDEQWENFLKLNQSATATTYGVLVNDFLDQTNDEPSASKIREVFEEGKERDPDDQASEPAFHKPYAAEFEYLVGDYQKFLDKETAKLSEEELREEYERRLKGGDFQIDDLPATDILDELEDESADEEEALSEGKTEEAMTQESVGSDQATEALDRNSSEEAIDSPQEDRKEVTPSGDKAQLEEPSPEDQSSRREGANANAIRLVNFQNEEDTVVDAAEDAVSQTLGESEQEEASDSKSGEESKSSEEATESSKSSEADEKGLDQESKNASGSPATEAGKADSSVEFSAGEPAEKGDAAEQEDGAEGESKPADEPEPKTESFEDVRDELAAELAGPAARAAMDEAITKVNRRMKKYFSKLALHSSNEVAGQVSEPPARPDLEQLGKEFGLTRGTTTLMTRTEIAETAISKSFDVGANFGQRGIDFTNMMYGYPTQRGTVAPKPTFSVIRFADDQAGLIYVAWKVAERDAYTPTLDEVREEVVSAIRMEEARGLAKAEAESLAKQANEGADLATLIPEDKKDNLKTGLGPFTWLNMVGFRQITVGNIPELDSVGDDFMKAAFSTDEGGFSVAANQPRRVYYVIKPEKLDPSVEELRERFKQPINRMMSGMVGGGANGVIRGYYETIDNELGYESFLGGDE